MDPLGSARYWRDRQYNAGLRPSLTLPSKAVLYVVAVAATTSCSSPSFSKLPFGFVDAPRPGETLRGAITIAGWALSEDRIERVAIYIDRSYASRALLGQARPDVAKAYPGMPNAAVSGWITVLNTGSFSQGKHEIIVQARSEDGALRDIGTVPVVFAPPVVSWERYSEPPGSEFPIRAAMLSRVGFRN
jgi:hypothetical protein